MEKDNVQRNLLHKSPTGIEGFDEITSGGLPTGRPTLIDPLSKIVFEL